MPFCVAINGSRSVTRRSPDLVAVDTLQVARALRCIQVQSANALPGVDAVVAATALSRRPP